MFQAAQVGGVAKQGVACALRPYKEQYGAVGEVALPAGHGQFSAKTEYGVGHAECFGVSKFMG